MATRTNSSPLLTLLYFGNNFHLEHHLYPGVPCYRLPAVHSHLKSLGVFDQLVAPIGTDIASYFAPMLRVMPYPREAGTGIPRDGDNPYVNTVAS